MTALDNLKTQNAYAEVRTLYNTYTAAAVPTTDTINMVVVPRGYRVVNVELTNAALGATTTLAVEDGTNTYIAATSTVSAGHTRWTPTTALMGVRATADTTIYLTVGGAAITGDIVLKVDIIPDFSV